MSNKEFAEKTGKAFKQVIHSPKNTEVLRRFRCAYEHKRSFRWLGESNEFGLTYALSHALAMIDFFDPQEDTLDSNLQIHPFERPFKRKMLEAVDQLISNPSNLDFFTDLLRFDRIDTESLSIKSLKKHVINAFDIYGRHARNGTSLDPW